MKFDVVCFGSAFVDVFLKSDQFKTIRSKTIKTGVAMCEVMGGKTEVDELEITTGGGATNSAVSFERKGIEAGVVACVGNDHWGHFVKTKLKQEGASLVHLQTHPQSRTSYSTVLVNSEGRRTVLAYRGASSQIKWRQVRWQALNADWFYVSSLGGDLDLLTKIVRTAQDKKIKIALNPGSKEIRAQDKLIPFLSKVEVLILNAHEASELTGKKSTQLAKMTKQLSRMGPRIVAVTQGDKGARVRVGRKVFRCQSFKVNCQEQTGAGDAFGSGLVAGLILGFKPKKAIKLALANSASVVTKMGSKAGLIWKDEVNSWMKKRVKIN